MLTVKDLGCSPKGSRYLYIVDSNIVDWVLQKVGQVIHFSGFRIICRGARTHVADDPAK